jgi:hypothetical protein
MAQYLLFFGSFTVFTIFRISNFFGLSTIDETLLIEMRIWCIKICIVLVLHYKIDSLQQHRQPDHQRSVSDDTIRRRLADNNLAYVTVSQIKGPNLKPRHRQERLQRVQIDGIDVINSGETSSSLTKTVTAFDR